MKGRLFSQISIFSFHLASFDRDSKGSGIFLVVMLFYRLAFRNSINDEIEQ